MKTIKPVVIGNLDLLLSILIAAVFLILMHYQILLPVRRMLSLLLLLFIPGYLLLVVLYPQKQDLAFLERGYLSIAASLAISILVGMGLNTSIVGRGLFLFTESLIGFVLLFSYMAFLRRFQAGAKSLILIKKGISRYSISLDPKLSVYIGLAAIALGIFYYFALFQNNNLAVSISQMYIERVEDQTISISQTINTGSFERLRLVLRNYERQPMDYEIVELIEGEEFKYLGHVYLEPGEEWSVFRQLPPINDSKVIYYAFKSTDFSEPYREVYLWIGKPDSN